MGTKFCCNEDRSEQLPSKEDENNNDDNDKNINENDNNKNNENNLSLPLYNNNVKQKNMRNKSELNYLEDINNMKSSIFDNENENQNYNNNEESNNNNVGILSSKKINKIVNSSKDNLISKNSNIRIKKKKSDLILNNSDKDFTDIKKVIKNNPDYKKRPLKIKNYNDNKENEFYLINNAKYIGLKNTNSNLVFIKNKYQNNGIVDSIELIKSKQDLNIKNINNYDEEENDSKQRIVYTRYSYSNKNSESINENINISLRNHNIPYDEKITDKINSSTQKLEINPKIPEVINQDPIIQNIHTNNQKLIEIYIKNQVRKIIKFLEDKTKRQDEPKKIINSKKLKGIINNNNLNDDALEDENQLIKVNSINNLKNNEINDISSSLEVINTNNCQTIMNKEKNFCIKFFSNGSVYIGEIKSDKLCGHGKFLNVQGDIIVGFFNDNCFHGYNIIERSQNNSKFEGQFEKNKFNGYGLEQFADGSNYYGQYKNNEKWGIGTYSWGDKYQYQGEWKYGRPNGVGIFIDDKNRYYEGEWKNGKMNGIGLFKWDDGRKYFGMFKDDKRHGFGIYFWNNPLKIYMGFWINGLQNGIGKILTSFKEKYYLWNNGKIEKRFQKNNDINLQIDKKERNKMKKYQFFFKLTTDDMLTYILDL